MPKFFVNLSFSVICGAISFAVLSPVADKQLVKFGAAATIAAEMMLCTAIDLRGRKDA